MPIVSSKSADEVEVRFLNGDDAEAYWQIRLEALEQATEAFSSSAEEHRAMTAADVRSRLTSDPENNFVVGGFAAGHLVGTAGFYRETGPKGRHKARIWGVYLKPEMRGRGIGRLMLRVLLNRAAGIEKLEQILLSVTVTQRAAIQLYTSLGFMTFGLEPNALKIGNKYVDESYMVLHMNGKGSHSNGQWADSDE